MFVLQMQSGRYVRKFDGSNNYVIDPREATVFLTRESADAAKPGHSRAMGGNGRYTGTIVTLRRAFDEHRKLRSRRR